MALGLQIGYRYVYDKDWQSTEQSIACLATGTVPLIFLTPNSTLLLSIIRQDIASALERDRTYDLLNVSNDFQESR